MAVDEKQALAAQGMSIQIVWRNQSASVSANLRAKQQNDPYCRWAEQAGKIRARRSNWDAKHVWGV
jgi:hypothetical protein